MIPELAELKVSVDRVVFAPRLEAPPERPYPFVYFITIRNQSNKTVTIRGRKWVVTDSKNQSIVVEGDGVVGKHPTLAPGESFSYNSYHVTGSDSVARGSFLALTEDNVPVFVKIPPFALNIPQDYR
jgi:ApaG protein